MAIYRQGIGSDERCESSQRRDEGVGSRYNLRVEDVGEARELSRGSISLVEMVVPELCQDHRACFPVRGAVGG